MHPPSVLTVLPTAVAPSRRRRILVAGILLAVSGCMAVVFLYSLLAGRKDLRQSIVETDRLDPGWTLADLEASRSAVADEQNAGVVILPGRQYLPFPAGVLALADAIRDLPPTGRLSATQLAGVRAELARVGSYRQRIRTMVDLPEGRYPLNYTPNLVDTLLPHVDALTTVEMLLRFDAVLRAEEEDADGALTSARGMLNAARSLGDEVFPVSQMVRLARGRDALYVGERALAQGQPSAAALEAFQKLLESEEKFPSFLVGARGERAMCHALLTGLESGQIQRSRLRAYLGGQPVAWWKARAEDYLVTFSSGSVRLVHAATLQYLNRYVEGARLSPEEQGEVIAELEADWPSLPQLARDLLGFAAGRGRSILAVLGDAYHRSRAELRCAAAAVAAERYRRMHRTWPEALEVLVPAYLPGVPVDPYDGRPLRYRRLADGLVIYALGPDRKDNGGAVSHAPTLPADADVGFRLWDVAKRRQAAKPTAESLPPGPGERNP
jgi:hypothetical protein